jgi:hypothetical protein
LALDGPFVEFLAQYTIKILNFARVCAKWFALYYFPSENLSGLNGLKTGCFARHALPLPGGE